MASQKWLEKAHLHKGPMKMSMDIKNGLVTPIASPKKKPKSSKKKK